MESQLGEEVWSLQTRVPVRKGHNFGSHRWIYLKFSQEFLEADFLGVDVESLLGESGVSSLETGVPVRKCHNFGSDRLISLNFSQEFPEAVFLGV